MTADRLRARTAKDLAQLAKKAGIAGWHGMRKEELVMALLLTTRRQAARATKNGQRADKGSGGPKNSRTRRRKTAKPNRASQSPRNTDKNSPTPSTSAKATPGQATSRVSGTGQSGKRGRQKPGPRNGQSRKTRSEATQSQIDQWNRKQAAEKNLAATDPNRKGLSPQEVQLVVMVRDPYWLHVNWDISEQAVLRARAAMGENWYQGQPILRLYQVEDNSAHTLARDIPIHGGVNHWYVDVPDPPQKYRLEIGYLASNSSFYCLARSNTVSTPPAGTSDAVDNNWRDVALQADRIFAMSGGYSANGVSSELQEILEERLNRPLGSPMKTRYGKGAASQNDSLQFAVESEMIVYGAVDKGSHVTLQGEPVNLQEDGTFTVRVSMPNRRQVIPVVACSADGTEQRTIVMAVERNTKTMETVHRDLTI